jgi:hypothetical protein
MIHCIKVGRYENNGQEFLARSYEGDDGTSRWQPLIEFAVDAALLAEEFSSGEGEFLGCRGAA